MSLPVLVWVVLSAIWGSTWLFIKIGLEDLPPFTFAAMRFAIAVVPLLAYARLRGLTLPRARADWSLMVVTGVLTFGFTYGLVFWGEQYISSGLAALLFATFPLFGLIIAHYMLASERMTVSKLVGVFLGVVGVGLIFSGELYTTDGRAVLGSAAIVLAALAAAYADVLIKLRGRHIDPAMLTIVQMVSGIIPLAVLGALLERDVTRFHWSALTVFSLFYLAVVGSALAFVLLYWLIQHMAVTQTMLITFATPLVAVMLGIVFLNEELRWPVAVGGVAILLGMGLTVWERTETLKRVRPRLDEQSRNQNDAQLSSVLEGAPQRFRS